MLKPSFFIAAVALATGAQAAPMQHHFSYTGFFHKETAQFLPTASLGGYFDSDDLNGNGVVELDEVTSFVLGDQQYVGNCGAAFLCGLFEFSYVPGGALDFYASWATNPWEEYFAGGEVRAGVEALSYAYGPAGSSETTYRWTDQTVFSFAAVPVPEPASYALLGLGLGLLALRARRRPRS